MKSDIKDEITETFIKLGDQPSVVETNDISNIETLVKLMYYGRGFDESMTLNQLRKHQFNRSTSNDVKKIAPCSDALYMQMMRAVHVAGFEWVECVRNITIPDPSMRGFILKNDVYVPKWLSSPST